MRDEYDFSNGKKNPYAKKLKKQITINIDSDTIAYFKQQAEASGIPYQALIIKTDYSEKSAIGALYDAPSNGIESLKKGDVYTIDEAWEEIDEI